jgi:hypothetical protein
MLEDDMTSPSRHVVLGILAAAIQAIVSREAMAQQGITSSLPASAVMARSGHDTWQSQGGVVGPWWSGSGTGATPPVGSGGFWFGYPGLGFGGSQGATRGLGAIAPSVTTMNGGNGFMSSSRLTPFVTGVVPVVGSGGSQYQSMPATLAPILSAPTIAYPSVSSLPTVPTRVAPIASAHSPVPGTITPAARDRIKELVAAGDMLLVNGTEGPTAAKAALAEYRSAARFTKDDADLEIRQSILYEALGKRRDADRAVERATRIDRRLGESLDAVPADAGGFLAPSPPGLPVVAERGFVILRGMQATDEQPSGRSAPPVIEWLSEAWARRWGSSAVSAMLPAP